MQRTSHFGSGFALAVFLVSIAATPSEARYGEPRAPANGPVAEDEADLDAAIARMHKLRDVTEPADLELIGKSGEERGLEALLEIYPHLSSIGSRQRTVDALCAFVGQPALEHRALEQVLKIAGDESSPAVQRAAIRALEKAGGVAQDYLAMVVDAPLTDDVRVLAMQSHTRSPRDKDYAWYREVWKPTPRPEPSKKRGSNANADVSPAKKPYRLRRIVDLAFGAVASRLEPAELVTAAAESTEITASRGARAGAAGQRILALTELDRRKHASAVEVASQRFDDANESVAMRVLAADILARAKGEEALDAIVAAGSHRDAPANLWRGLGAVVARHASAEYAAGLVKRLGRARGGEKLMLLASLAKHEDPKLANELRKLIDDRDEDVRAFAVQALGERGDAEALSDLERRFGRTKDATEAAILLRTIIEIRGPKAKEDAEWRQRLADYAKGENAAFAALAVVELERLDGPDAIPTLEVALQSPEWSVRLAAAEALERLRTKKSVELLVRRLGEESGRLRIEMSRLLWSLTGQGFDVHADQWKRWWDDTGHELEPITVAERDGLALERELRRLEQATNTEFFGLELNSQRVTFIIDVSGSMEERTRGRYQGESGETRLAVAKKEMLKVLDELDPNTLFNIIVFSEKGRAWEKELMRATPDALEKARAYVNKFLAGGGTNVHEALEIAFADPALDTLFVLSDGEPSVGKVVDAAAIRDHVRRWNIGRNVRIHTIAVGDPLPILRWLSEDTGGYHAHIP